MTTAFVLSGGGSLGAVQVGMLAALHERDFQPDVLIGTSVGALNAAYVGAHGFDSDALEQLGAVWRRIRRPDVFPLDPLRQALALAGRRSSLCSAGPLRRLIDANLSFTRLEDSPIPLHVVATDVLSGEELLLSSGDARSAVLASAAIPAVFPAVEREGRLLMDGGVANNTAISQAVALGADRIVVLPTGFSCALLAPPATPLGSALHALTLLIEQRLIVEVAHFAERADIIVLPPLCPLSVSAIDFGASDALMTQAHRASADWLDAGHHQLPHPERFLSLHSHRWVKGTKGSVDGEDVTPDVGAQGAA